MVRFAVLKFPNNARWVCANWVKITQTQNVYHSGSGLVPYITETAIGKRKELKVFGSDYDTRDGSCIRDYIHVIYIAKAHILAVQHLIDGKTKGYDVINLGSGNGSTVLEMIHAFERATGLTIPYSLAPRRAGDVPAVYANIGKAQRVLNWTPEKSLEDMLRDAWNFEQSLTQEN